MNFSRSQRNGLIVLSFLMVLSFFIPKLFGLFETHNRTDFSEYEKQIDNLYKQKKTLYAKTQPKKDIKLFKFNPNVLDEQAFYKLGLSPKQVKQILNYRDKGGKFKIKTDLAKIYAIDNNTYQKLEPYIQLPEKIKHQTTKVKNKVKTFSKNQKVVKVNICTADEKTLQTIKGIGAVFSKRIVAFRNKLGGFYSKNQLKEVYGISPEIFQKIEPQVFVEGKVTKLNVNFSTAGELSKHPYISKKLGKQIAKERSINGAYKSLDDFIKRINIFSDELEKLKPYIEI